MDVGAKTHLSGVETGAGAGGLMMARSRALGLERADTLGSSTSAPVRQAGSLPGVTSHLSDHVASDTPGPRARGSTKPRGEGTASPPGRGQSAEADPDLGGKAVAPLTPGRATPGYRSPEPDQVPDSDDPRPRLWVDQQLCTGDGFCAKLAPEQFRMHCDGLAYVVGSDGDLRTGPGQSVPVLPDQVRSILAAAVKCPGDCIYVLPGADGTVYGLASPREGPSPTHDPP
ncbi:MAG: ferredoxin [Nitriliruptorales bacterium]